MNLLDLVGRQSQPEPWAEGEKIPWHEAAFSQRMLQEHLSQLHDAASRRFAVIDQHIAWIHHTLLAERPSHVLDLGCGPGLYTSRLAKLGHRCTGIDFAPAPVAYARQQATDEHLPCLYIEGDLRTVDFGASNPVGYGLAMFIFGELNVFRRQDAQTVLQKAQRALAQDGTLLLEAHTFETVRRIGLSGTSWYTRQHGLFSAQPHLCLHESFWDEACSVATERYYVVDAHSGDIARHAASTQAYTEQGYRRLLTDAGFAEVNFQPAWPGLTPADSDFVLITAHKVVLNQVF
jgi:ubiquinone/menaquinone biosynthesis C-methylase UbiE